MTATKRLPLFIRMVIFTIKLFIASRGADVIYVQKAAAAGLPAVIVGLLCRIPVVVNFINGEAWERAGKPWRTRLMISYGRAV